MMPDWVLRVGLALAVLGTLAALFLLVLIPPEQVCR